MTKDLSNVGDHAKSLIVKGGGGSGSLFALATFVILLRLPFFDSPTVHIDEQFYLTVADKWIRHGLVPFVDIWDRKPLGTFLIYTLPAAIPGYGILAYQILATVFVIATGLLIVAVGRRLFDKDAGLAAALIYAVAVVLMEGPGGQTPVFYNLFVCAGVLLYLTALSSQDTSRQFVWPVLGSLLFGTAIQIKYICAIEAAALSILLLVGLRSLHRWSTARLLSLALVMVACGLFPTLLVAACYAANGHFVEFWDANFMSILAKRLWHLSPLEYLHRLVESSLFCSFFLPFAAYSAVAILRDPSRGPRGWGHAVIVVWLIAALPGALGLGNPTRHYFLPTLMPLSLLTAAGLRRAEATSSRLGQALRTMRAQWGSQGATAVLLFVPVIAALVIAWENPKERGEAADVYAIADYIKAHNPTGACPFIFNRLPVLYYLADACAPSIYLFPNHLSEIGEVQTPGKERLIELHRVLESEPPLIYVRRPYSNDLDPEAIGMLEQTLARYYQLSYVSRGYRQYHAVYTRTTEPSAR